MPQVEVVIRQQPMRGRMVGFDNSGSYLFPELIIQITPNKGTKEIDCSTLICSINLESPDGTEDRTVVQRPARKNAIPGTGINLGGDFYFNLLGGRISQAWHLIDPIDQQFRYFFVFPDLKIRAREQYRLNCAILVPNGEVIATVKTEVFEVFHPNEFTGVGNPTELTKNFYIQGVPFRGRNKASKKD